MAIDIQQLSYHYPNGQEGLKDITLSLKRGRKIAVLGMNGSGKSTLLNHLNGSLLPQRGRVEILGLELNKKNRKEIRRRVGFLFDIPDHQLFSTTVYNDLTFGLDNYGVPKQQQEEKVLSVAEKLDITHLLEIPPHLLSLGQKKRVAAAGILVMEPELILCDEPFSGLDGPGARHFKSILDDWVKRDKKTLIFSTHDIDLTFSWADDVILLKDHALVVYGSVTEVLLDNSLYSDDGFEKPLLLELFDGVRNREEARQLVIKQTL